MAAKVANGNGLSNEYVAFEADALQHLQGVPGVVQLVGSGTSHGCEFVVME